MTTHSTAVAPADITTRGITGLQFAFALCGLVALSGFLAAGAIPAAGAGLPGWLGMTVALAVGVVAVLLVHYWRIRPVPPGDLRRYAATVGMRVGLALVPAAAAIGLYLLTGTWAVHLVGLVASGLGMVAAFPNGADYLRHQEAWTYVMPEPDAALWGTAGPDEIPMWVAADPCHRAHHH